MPKNSSNIITTTTIIIILKAVQVQALTNNITYLRNSEGSHNIISFLISSKVL